MVSLTGASAYSDVFSSGSPDSTTIVHCVQAASSVSSRKTAGATSGKVSRSS